MQALSMYHDCSIRHKLLTVMMTITVALFECAQNGRWKNTFFFFTCPYLWNAAWKNGRCKKPNLTAGNIIYSWSWRGIYPLRDTLQIRNCTPFTRQNSGFRSNNPMQTAFQTNFWVANAQGPKFTRLWKLTSFTRAENPNFPSNNATHKS